MQTCRVFVIRCTSAHTQLVAASGAAGNRRAVAGNHWHSRRKASSITIVTSDSGQVASSLAETVKRHLHCWRLQTQACQIIRQSRNKCSCWRLR